MKDLVLKTRSHNFPMSTTKFVSTDYVRARFSSAMSQMYRLEVPQYGILVELVRQVNAAALKKNPGLHERLQSQGELDRIDEERHGAIRLGTAAELATICRIFRVMGMEPVGYYDLSEAGVPVHSTAFRPVTEKALQRNPFRVFTSLLRLELLRDVALRSEAAAILAKRKIFSEPALALLEQFEINGVLSHEDADEFVTQVLQTFRWHNKATVDAMTYKRLHAAHPLVADIVCFNGPHINHLTPRTLDIDAAQMEMLRRGMQSKDVIEGPPRRKYPILLRQTSFKALVEHVSFGVDDINGTHTARFGEVEQRGMALTPAGRRLYDDLLSSAQKLNSASSASMNYPQLLTQAFCGFPDDLKILSDRGLVFCRYQVADEAAFLRSAQAGDPWDLHQMVGSGLIDAEPITYEDFLPISAAGIFQSNLKGAEQKRYNAASAKGAFEAAMQSKVLDEMALYSDTESASIDLLRARFSLVA